MPHGDGTGPLGLRPMTGIGTGYCAGYAVPGFLNPRGGGRFCGKGGGRRFGGWFGYVPPVAPGYPMYGTPVANPGFTVPPAAAPAGVELSGLKAQAEYMKKSLDQISKRIEELDGMKEEKAE